MPFYSSRLRKASNDELSAFHHFTIQTVQTEHLPSTPQQDPRRAHTLRSDLKEIRLLCLQPGQGTDPLRCKIQYTVLSSKKHQKYETVSYCWGRKPGEACVSIDGVNVTVTNSSARVLQRLRHPGRERVVGIDAICIDQAHDVEKGAQVAFMSEIYRNGSSNFVWLGDSSTLDAMRVVRTIKSVLANMKHATSDFEDKPYIMYGPGANNVNGDLFDVSIDLAPLLLLFSRPWFGRLWVAQEATLSPTSICHLGQVADPLSDVNLEHERVGKGEFKDFAAFLKFVERCRKSAPELQAVDKVEIRASRWYRASSRAMHNSRFFLTTSCKRPGAEVTLGPAVRVLPSASTRRLLTNHLFHNDSASRPPAMELQPAPAMARQCAAHIHSESPMYASSTRTGSTSLAVMMARGGTAYMQYTAVALLSSATGSRAGLWDVDIDLSPAPPAESGPQFSAHASRNRDLLPYQIIGILGAYVASVLIIGLLLLTVGRRSRKQAQALSEKPVEMVKPAYKNFDPSPTSPSGSSRGWFGMKPRSIRSTGSNIGSPGMHSVASVDQSVVDHDRRRWDEELAQIYERVLEHDDARAQGLQHVAGAADVLPAAPPAYGRERPTLPALKRVQCSEPALHSPLSPRSPTSPYYAVAPPQHRIPPISPRYKNDAPRSPLRESRNTRTASYGSERTTESSPGKLRKKLGNLNVRTPTQGLRDNHDGAREPLSPRHYTNPGPSPELHPARTTDNHPYSPATPGTAASYTFPEEDEQFDMVHQLPQAHPQRTRGYTNDSQPPQSPTSPGLPSSPTQFRVGTPPRRGNTPVGNVNRPLALRHFNEQHKQEAEAVQQSELRLASPTANRFPLSPAAPGNTRSPQFGALESPAIQTTVLSTRDHQTLYSPWFPGVHTTPVTAHFTTRAERKQKEKEEKTIRGAITEDNQVPDEKDLWRDAY